MAAALVLLLAPATQARADMHCAPSDPAGLYACASMTVSFDAGVITIKVQNADLWAVANGINPAGHGYAVSGFGVVAPEIAGSVSLLSYGTEGAVMTTGSPNWTFTTNVNGFSVEAGASANGINGGILGCNQTFGSKYYQTCSNIGTPAAANTGWVVFNFQTELTNWDAGAAQLAMRAQGGAWSYRCENTGTASNGAPCTPPTTTPEPISMVLLGTGLLGLGVVRRRRRTIEEA